MQNRGKPWLPAVLTSSMANYRKAYLWRCRGWWPTRKAEWWALAGAKGNFVQQNDRRVESIYRDGTVGIFYWGRFRWECSPKGPANSREDWCWIRRQWGTLTREITIGSAKTGSCRSGPATRSARRCEIRGENLCCRGSRECLLIISSVYWWSIPGYYYCWGSFCSYSFMFR